MKNIFKWLLMAAAVLAFASCTDKNNNGDEPEPEPGVLSKKVASIKTSDRDGDRYIILFEYDNQGRITQLKNNELYGNKDTEIITLTYSSNKVTISGMEARNIELNWDGKKATSCSSTEFFTSAIFDYSEGYSAKSTYKENNQSNMIISYTWSNGNLSEISQQTSDYSARSNQFTYGNQKNNSNIDLMSFTIADISGIEVALKQLGLHGDKSKLMPSSVSFYMNHEGSYSIVYPYTYTTDAQGYITKMSTSTNRGYYNYEITYK